MPIQFSYKLTNTNIYAHLMYRIHKQNTDKLDAADILGITEKSVQQFNQQLRHKECNILIYADFFATIPEQGIGGRCSAADTVLIFIDPNHKKGIKHNVRTWLPSAIAHELFHARRYATYPTTSTLGEALINEGLSTIFEEYANPKLKAPYAHHLSKKEIADAWKKARPLLNSQDFNHDDWFYGGDGIKKWTGYSLGYDIVKLYMASKGINNPASIIDEQATIILKRYNPSKN
ncbi:MAG: DUF2268 domain-containing putative Zn-dependent protease [bacterium]|nr:DUF2268 domain-containing putative Zn-dependent protease [bacterium]